MVVGAHAVGFHGHPRVTQDLDLLVRPTLDNGRRIVEALNEFGFGALDVSAETFTAPERMIQLGRSPNRLDLLTGILGVSVEDVWSNRVPAKLDGVSVWMIGRTELIKNKRATGRTQDLADAERLEARPPRGPGDPP